MLINKTEIADDILYIESLINTDERKDFLY